MGLFEEKIELKIVEFVCEIVDCSSVPWFDVALVWFVNDIVCVIGGFVVWFEIDWL